jgi:flagellar motor component MotA
MVPSVLVFTIFILFVVIPFIDSGFYMPDFMTEVHWSIVHPASLCYIGLSFLVYVFYSRVEARSQVFAKQNRLSHRELVEPNKLLLAISGSQSGEKDNLLDLFHNLKDRSANSLVGKITHCVENGLGEDCVRLSVAHLTDSLAHYHGFLARYGGQVSSTLPLLGMTGTIAGLLFMFTSDGVSDDRSTQLAGLGMALLTTPYASLITVLITKQCAKWQADKVEELHHLSEQVRKSGLSLVANISSFEVAKYHQRNSSESFSHAA